MNKPKAYLLTSVLLLFICCVSYHHISKAQLLNQAPKNGTISNFGKIEYLACEDKNGNNDSVVVNRNTQLICHMKNGKTQNIYFTTGKISEDTIIGYRSRILRIKKHIPLDEIDTLEVYSEFMSSCMKCGECKNKISFELMGPGMFGLYYGRSLLKHTAIGIGTNIFPPFVDIGGYMLGLLYLDFTTPDYYGHRLFAEPTIFHNFYGSLPKHVNSFFVLSLGYSYVNKKTGFEFRLGSTVNYYDFPMIDISLGHNF